ncbi:MAG: hypothetical protein IJ774_05470 [Selenomonadaceae bacterium]|nr:hypothetical protein [Selenomonadaceae bacterium]MBR1805824.1 hypothetical protein [Selenomonadaceae bacterium]
MKDTVQTFADKRFGKIRVATIDRVPWFVGKDVATVLGFSNPERAVRKIVAPEFKAVTVLDTSGGKQEATVINEAGLRQLVAKSHFEGAEAFANWILENVSPSSRNANIQVFSNEEFGDVRVLGDFDNPLFCLADVCRVLDLPQVAKVVQRLDKGVLSTHPVETAGGVQQMYFVNEDGLYDVILDSRKPNAKKFRKWLTGEVVPSIRKTGRYSVFGEENEPEENDSVTACHPQKLSPQEKLNALFKCAELADNPKLHDSIIRRIVRFVLQEI